MEVFQRVIQIGWGDMDANGHMRNSAYMDAASDIRMMFFMSHGITAAEFARWRIGPIALKDVLDYQRELHLLDEVRVTLEATGRSEDGSRFRLRNTFYRPDGKLAATLTTDGAWLDLDQRRITRPPESLLAAIQDMAGTDDFEILPSGVKEAS
ncbi:MAG: thioesterase family protein [Candidatus Promineifilaceae bacterium]